MAEVHLTLTSPAFQEGEYIPRRHTCDGEDTSPLLEWLHVPDSTRSFALILDDPDAPGGSFTHWLLWNIPASCQSLPEGVRDIGVAGRNDFQFDGYGGPCPPPHHGDHRYFFTLTALEVESLDLPGGARRAQVDAAIKPHTVARTQLMGRYQRRKA